MTNGLKLNLDFGIPEQLDLPLVIVFEASRAMERSLNEIWKQQVSSFVPIIEFCSSL